MRYAIYSLQTKQLLRNTEVDEEISYDPQTEGYVEVADYVYGDARWCDKHLSFELADDPTKNLSSVDFLQRFTLSERCTLYSEARENNIIVDMLFQILTSGTIHLCSDVVKASFDYLISNGLTTTERAFEIRGY